MLILYFSTMDVRGLVYSLNPKGPIVEPCGNPNARLLLSDMVPFISMQCFLLVR